MKKAFIIIATIILATMFTVSVSAANLSKDEVLNAYSTAIEEGNYFNSTDVFFVTTVNEQPIFQTYDGTVYYGNYIFNDSILSIEEIVKQYENALNAGEYYTTDASQHTVNLNGVECHQKMDGTFVYDGRVLIENIEEFTGYNVLKNYIGEFYIYQIRTGNYIESLGKMNYVVMTDTYALCYVNTDGNLICGGEVIYNCVATMDDTFTATIIYQQYGTAVTVDSDFIYVYHFGEIVDIINIHTGGHPRG